MVDYTLILYAILALLCYYGFLLFIWEWIRLKKASSVFKNLTFLWLGLGIQYTINYLARYQINNNNSYKEVMDVFSTWWPLRLILPLIIILIFLSSMTYRAFVIRRKMND